MLLPAQDAQAFLSLYQSLLGFAAGKLGGVSGVTDFASFLEAPLNKKSQVRDALFGRPGLIDLYASSTAHGVSLEDRDAVRGWRRFIQDSFVVVRDMNPYTVFLASKEPIVAYGVLGLTTEIVEMIPQPLPAMVDTVLLPWKGRIVCDGLLSTHQVMFGSNYRRSFNDTVRALRTEGRIITTLDDAEPTVKMPGQSRRKLAARRRVASRPPKAGFTKVQGQYLTFIALYTKLHRRPPAEADIQEYFRVAPPTVHQMILTLDRLGLIRRTAGAPRSIEVLVPQGQLPPLE